MANTKSKSRRNVRGPGPIGTLGAMCTGSLATLIGIVYGLEPQVILFRAGVSAVLMGVLLSLGMSVIQLANLRPPRNRVGRRV